MRIMSTDEKGNTKYFCNVCQEPNRSVSFDGIRKKIDCRCEPPWDDKH